METRFCVGASRYIFRLTSHHKPAASISTQIRNLTKKHNSHQERKIRYASTQANPLGGFYESLLENPHPSPGSDPAAAKLRAASSAMTNQPDGDTLKEEVAAKARVVFGSRLAGPAERRRVKERDSKIVAGIRVPPRPEEPDNCCMSGCVNCVWDIFRDDVEEWAAIKRRADRALAAQLAKGGTGVMRGKGEKNAAHTMISIDDDGGGSETNRGSVEPEEIDEDEELFSGLPIGIREFMKQEKKLKARHIKEGTSGG